MFNKVNDSSIMTKVKFLKRGKKMKRVFELEFEGKKFVVEAGEIAKQADGAVLVRLNETVVLSTAQMNLKKVISSH